MEDAYIDKEQEQIRKIISFQKVASLIIRKWFLVLVTVFASLAIGLSLVIVTHYAKSGRRFEAKTQLLYNPRQIARIQNMSEKQLLTVLDRISIKRKIAEKISMSQSESACLGIDLDVVQEKKPPNLFTLTAYAPTKEGAVAKVNAYAEVMIEGYIEYRNLDLENWRDSIQRRKGNIQGQISDIESEENTLKGKSGVAAPAEMLTMLTGFLTDQRRNLSLLSVQIANEEKKKQNLEAVVGVSGRSISDNAALIRRKSEELEALDKEIAKLRELYTDKNPKVAGKLDERSALLEGYMKFLKAKGIEGVNIEAIDRLEKAAGELAEIVLKLDVMDENRRALEQEIKANEKRTEELTTLIPAFDRLRVKRADLEQTLRDLDDQVENIVYLQMSVRNDLRQVEQARGAGDNNPLRPKNFVMAFGGAFFGTISLAFWLIILEFYFGKLIGGGDFKAYDDILYLGALPKPGKMSEKDEKDALGVVALKFINADLPKGIVLVSRLQGADEQPKFRDALDWSLTMSGDRTFYLDVVSGSDFTPPDGSESLLCAVKKGDVGWFPVDNHYTLAPTELQMLQADLATLRGEYDHVFVRIEGGIRKGGSFFSQMLGVCDIALVVAGVGKTPRSWFTYARRCIIEADKPMMGIATGASKRMVKVEMETKS